MSEQQSSTESGENPLRIEVFPRAPVVEAILSFRFPLLDNLSDTIRILAGDIESDFPGYETFTEAHYPPFNPKSGQEKGYRFHSIDSLHVLRLTRTAFSFHRLKPYSRWEDLVAGATVAWERVCQRYEPEYVSSVSLRYLNQIPLPPYGDLKDYVALSPDVPTSIDTGFEDYLLRLVLKDSSVPARAELTQVASGVAISHLTFDIEVTTDVHEFLPRARELWEQVERLRDYKNRLFFASITDACRELFR